MENNRVSDNSKLVQFAFDEEASEQEQKLIFSCSTVTQAKELLKKHRKDTAELWDKVQTTNERNK